MDTGFGQIVDYKGGVSLRTLSLKTFKFSRILKTITGVLLASSMVLATACGGSVPQAGNTANTAAGGGASGGQKVLNFWYIDPGAKEQVYKDAVARFEQSHPGVQVKMLRIPNDQYKQKFAVAMSGGNGPDVFHSWGGGWLKQFVDAGQVLDLAGKIDSSHYLKAALDNATFNGKVYGVPLGLSVTAVYYNKEIFQKLNLQPPKTWDDLLSVIQTLKKNNITHLLWQIRPSGQVTISSCIWRTASPAQISSIPPSIVKDADLTILTTSRWGNISSNLLRWAPSIPASTACPMTRVVRGS
ncbi:extracellular solute-binding protein [Alicyclobacillus macrosporangiidus]|uniref:Extracellular solute-binding protein n=1 Tax=Alicyclobacillus macrosporangiidus TaxID=392015 RepID=A0A1I7L4S7_9BACL|nr:extracellular solute-binding protein [Alicyclobacillus macrosporangiidus]